jgi:hypothetical protein
MLIYFKLFLFNYPPQIQSIILNISDSYEVHNNYIYINNVYAFYNMYKLKYMIN